MKREKGEILTGVIGWLVVGAIVGLFTLKADLETTKVKLQECEQPQQAEIVIEK